MNLAMTFPAVNQIRRKKESERMKLIMDARRRIEALQDLREIGVYPQDYHLISP